MADNDWLAERFEEHRAHLRAVAYRMLGSLTEADEYRRRGSDSAGPTPATSRTWAAG